MTCQVPTTSLSFRRHSPPTLPNPPTIAARLDLSRPGERAAQDLLRRFGSGRWPVWRVLDLRRIGQMLYVAVQWRGVRAPFSVVEVSLKAPSLRWRYVLDAQAARSALNQLEAAKPARSRLAHLA